MKTFKAKPVIVPSDLAERLDKATKRPEGYLRNLIADGGKLHELDSELLAIGLMSMVKGMMEDKNLPDDTKPLSRERLGHVVYVVMFSYCSGTMHVEDDGDVSFGSSMEDLKMAMELSLSDKIKFANGKTMHTKEFMHKLKLLSEPQNVDGIYDKVVKRQGLTKGITPQAAFSVAKLSIVASKELILK